MAVTGSPQAAGWLTRSAAGGVSSWSTTGISPTLSDLGGGKWDVKFGGITGAFGVPAVTPGNQYPGAVCAVDNYALVTGTVNVTFHCAKRSGVGVKSDFTLTYTSIAGASEGWVDANQPALNGVYTPSAQYNATGVGVTIAHNPASPGWYSITFPGLALTPSFGSTTATPVSAGVGHCSSGSEIWSDHTVVNVECFNAAGTPTDMRFVAHVVGSRGLLATTTPRSGWALYPNFAALGVFTPTTVGRYSSATKSVTINHTALGAYTFRFKGLASQTSRAAQATDGSPPGAPDTRCGAVASKSGADAIITVKCTNAAATPTDTTVTANFFGI